MTHANTQFKTLIQNEMQRLQGLVVEPAGGHYAVPSYRYSGRSAILLKGRTPSIYSRFLSLTRIVALFLF